MTSLASEVPEGTRILITGAEGFVGRWLRNSLLKTMPSGGLIVSTSKSIAGSDAKALGPSEFSVELDIENEAAIRDVIKRWNPDVVIHLAAVSHVVDAGNNPQLTLSVNFSGTIGLARAVKELAPEARFINVSSSEVYGGSFIGAVSPLREDAVLDPFNSYAASKAAADIVVGQMAREGLKSIRFRPFNHTGPGQSDRFVVSGFASQIARIEKGLQAPVINVGNLDAERDFTDVRDVVEAYVAAALCPQEQFRSGQIYNLCSGIPRQIGSILDDLLSMSTVRIQVVKDPMRMRGSEVPVIAGSAQKAKETFGWSPNIPWRETIESVLNHWRSTP